MGLLGDIGQIVLGAATGGVEGAILAFTAEHESKIVEGVVDVARQIVQIGSDVYRAIPDWAFAVLPVVTGGSVPIGLLHGLLKHEAENEIIWLGQLGANVVIESGLTWPVEGPLQATIEIAKGAVPLYSATLGPLIFHLHYRYMNDEEWQMARYIFGKTFQEPTDPPWENIPKDIVLTNLGGSDGKPFTIPGTTGTIFVNLGNAYTHDRSIPDGPILFHELTHAWQAKRDGLSDIFFYGARIDFPGTSNPYIFSPGKQWSDYNIEQQAVAVEAWARGATVSTGVGDRGYNFDLGSRNKFAIASPIFRYINGNIRIGDRLAKTSGSQSVRQLLTEGWRRSMKDLNPAPPTPWWP
ncbi:MAG: hypothetical protein C5B51_25850 [Terriglobia bacterium]|nr:MAG: hypothetical protein C5B51_25850 [Terriglobia bacterium]